MDGFFVISPNSRPCGPNFLTLLYPNLKWALNQQEKNIHLFKTKNKGFKCSKIYRFNSLLLSCAQSWIFKSLIAATTIYLLKFIWYTHLMKLKRKPLLVRRILICWEKAFKFSKVFLQLECGSLIESGLFIYMV